jgi:tripartite-type tricarboxylate transporter receptor subunit TctC
MCSSGVFAVNPGLYGAKLPYDPVKDFAPITVAVSVPLFLVANASFSPNTVKELIAYAKANPGKVNFASGGNGVTNHLAMELFRSTAGLDMVHVPYKGGPPALTALIAGEVQVMFETGPGALPHVKTGKLKAIAVGSAKRSSAAPEVPTVAESGLPGFESIAWICMAAPAGTPEPIINKLHGDIVKVLAMPDIKERFSALGADPVGNTPEEFSAYLKAEIGKWSAVVKNSGAKVD